MAELVRKGNHWLDHALLFDWLQENEPRPSRKCLAIVRAGFQLATIDSLVIRGYSFVQLLCGARRVSRPTLMSVRQPDQHLPQESLFWRHVSVRCALE